MVVANKTDYIKDILDIINDTNKFAKLESDPTINREGSLQRFLRNLKKNGKLTRIFTTLFIHQVHSQHVFMVCLKCIRFNPPMLYHH